jgi:hypothetical protein
MAQMRLAVDVIYCGGDIKPFFHYPTTLTELLWKDNIRESLQLACRFYLGQSNAK